MLEISTDPGGRRGRGTRSAFPCVVAALFLFTASESAVRAANASEECGAGCPLRALLDRVPPGAPDHPGAARALPGSGEPRVGLLSEIELAFVRLPTVSKRPDLPSSGSRADRATPASPISILRFSSSFWN